MFEFDHLHLCICIFQTGKYQYHPMYNALDKEVSSIMAQSNRTRRLPFSKEDTCTTEGIFSSLLVYSYYICPPPWRSHWRGHRNAGRPSVCVCVCACVVCASVTKLVSTITSDLMHRFMRCLTLWCIPPLPWMSSKRTDLDLPLTYFSRSQCKNSLVR